MSRFLLKPDVDNAEIVRRGFEAASRRPPDVETLLEVYSPDHALVTEWGTGDQMTYRGLEGFRQALEDISEFWDDFRNELVGAVEAGDDVVVATVRATGRGRASGVPVDARVGAVIRLQGGKMVSTQYYTSPESALEAAGLRGSAPNE